MPKADTTRTSRWPGAHAAARPDQPALIEARSGESISFAELNGVVRIGWHVTSPRCCMSPLGDTSLPASTTRVSRPRRLFGVLTTQG